MSVRNTFDGSLPIDASQVVHDITLTYTNGAGTNTMNVPSSYIKDGSVCILLLPDVRNFNNTNNDIVNITIPNEIVPSQSLAIYGIRFSNANAARYNIIARLTSGSNIISLTTQDRLTMNEGNFTSEPITIYHYFITYQTN